MNSVNLIGRFTRDPELRSTAEGDSVCSFSLAVQRSFKNNEGEYVADFINCVAWKKDSRAHKYILQKRATDWSTGRIANT